MAGKWTSYDVAAESHDRLAVPTFFDQPARDLVAKLDLASAASVLDIGTGSGVAAQHAAEVAVTSARVVGIDPSLEMLRIARSHGLRCLAVAITPGLPFANRTFDRVLASFVLSHIPSYEDGLLDITRLLKPHGRLGVTCWGSIENEYRAFWQSLAERFVSKQILADSTREALPWEEWFTEPDHLANAFQATGLIGVEVHRVVYTIHANISDFLALREASLQARFMRQALSVSEWERFKETAAMEFLTASQIRSITRATFLSQLGRGLALATVKR